MILITIIRRGDLDTATVADFSVTDLCFDRQWRDVVRLRDMNCSSPPAREVLSPYGFWLDLKKFVGDGEPAVHCNDMELLRHFHETYRRDTLRPTDPWPFSEEKKSRPKCSCEAFHEAEEVGENGE